MSRLVCFECGGATDIIVIHQFSSHSSIIASFEPFGKNKCIDLDKLINSL